MAGSDGEEILDIDVAGAAPFRSEDVVGGHQNPHPVGVDPELQRGGKVQGLAIDPCQRPSGAGLHFECGGLKLMQVGIPFAQAESGAGDQPSGFGARGRIDCEHAELAGVHRVALRNVQRRPHHVGVVGHQDQKRAVNVLAVRSVELQVEWLGLAPQEFRQLLLGGFGLRIAVTVLLHDGGVHAQRDVVHEEAITHGGVVHEALHAVAQGDHAFARVFPIEAKVQREVVAGTGADAHKGHPSLDGDRRH